jgi:hypothetical protein
MRILIDIGHPAHVHFFRNAIRELEGRGHEVKVTARDKDVALKLLDAYNIPYVVRGKLKGGLASKATDLFRVDMKILEVAKKFKPDIFLGIHNPYTAQVSCLLGVPSITFTDSEPVPIADYLTFPFTSVIITPTTFRKEIGKKHVTVKSYKELAYLHPNVFTPNKAVLDELGLATNEKYIVMRFVSWKASHDVGEGGFSNDDKIKIVNSLKDRARIIITSEKELPPELEPYRMKIQPHKFHDVLAFSSLLVTDSQTVTTEAACLGVPAVRCNSFVTEKDMGNFIELEQKYGLIFSFRNASDAMKKVEELMTRDDLKEEWAGKRKKMLDDKVDMTEFLCEFIEKWSKNTDG